MERFRLWRDDSRRNIQKFLVANENGCLAERESPQYNLPHCCKTLEKAEEASLKSWEGRGLGPGYL